MLIDPIRWAERFFFFDSSSTYQGRFQLSRAPWLGDIMEAFADPTVTSGVCRCSAQSGKTQTGMILLLWALCEDPGPTMWVLPASDEAKTFSTTRLQESILLCEPLVRLMSNKRYDFSKQEIHFASAPLLIFGAGSDSKISGKPIKYLLLDEEKNFKPGAVEKAMKRTRSKWDSKVWRMSTPDHEDDSIDLAFHAADQRHWHVHCPRCDQWEPLAWPSMKYEAEGLSIKDIHYACPTAGCEHVWRDVPIDREWISSQGKWIAHNPLCDPGERSWTWNAILPRWVAWKSIVTEWLKAQQALAIGDKQPLKVFFNETATYPWKEEYVVERPKVTITRLYSVTDFAAKGKKIEGEHTRFATIDRGKDHWWLLVRAWRKDGSSRLLCYEQIPTLERLKSALELYEVEPRFTLQDCGFEKQKVLQECAENGWIAVHGLPNIDSFVHVVKDRHGKKVREERRLYSDFEYLALGQGKSARLMNLCSQRLKDICHHFRSGAGALWEIPHDIGGIYLNQLVREGREEVFDTRTGSTVLRWQENIKNQHAWDCETYQISAALVVGLIGG